MQGKRILGVAALLSASGAAFGQGPVIVPKLFVWGAAPNNWPADDLVARVVHLDLYWPNWLQGVGYVDLRNATDGPENAALLTAKRIVDGTYGPGGPGDLVGIQLHGPMPSGKIAVLLKGMGDESSGEWHQ